MVDYRYLDKSEYKKCFIATSDLLRNVKHYLAQLITINYSILGYENHILAYQDEVEQMAYVDAIITINEFKCKTTSKRMRLLLIETLKKFATCNGFKVPLLNHDQEIIMTHVDDKTNIEDFKLKIIIMAYDDGNNVRINTKVKTSHSNVEQYEWKIDCMDIVGLQHYFEIITKNKWWNDFKPLFMSNRNRMKQSKTTWDILKFSIVELYKDKSHSINTKK